MGKDIDAFCTRLLASHDLIKNDTLQGFSSIVYAYRHENHHFANSIREKALARVLWQRCLQARQLGFQLAEVILFRLGQGWQFCVGNRRQCKVGRRSRRCQELGFQISRLEFIEFR